MGKLAPLVTVLMPAYNCEKYIKQAVQSILDQSHTNWELIIIDDSSTDNSIEVLKKFDDPRVKISYNKSNLGYLKTCNKLFSIASGDFITFQDADDFSSPDRLKKLLNAFHENPDLGMVGSYAVIVDQRGDFVRNDDKRSLTYDEILQNLPKRSQFNGATVMIKREVLNTVGGYREYLDGFAFQDYDWTYRITEKYYAINIPEYLYYYRQHPKSNSKKVSLERAISKDLVQWLATDRRKNNTDLLDRNETEKLDLYVKEKIAPYKLDPSLIFREYAANFMYNQLSGNAIKASLLAIKANPFKTINYRTLFYCLRKSL